MWLVGVLFELKRTSFVSAQRRSSGFATSGVGFTTWGVGMSLRVQGLPLRTSGVDVAYCVGMENVSSRARKDPCLVASCVHTIHIRTRPHQALSCKLGLCVQLVCWSV